MLYVSNAGPGLTKIPTNNRIKVVKIANSMFEGGICLQLTPLEELTERVKKLQSRLQQEGLDGALLTEKMDLFYFCGSMQQGFLFIPAGGEPLFMVRRNLGRAQEESAWKNILPLNSFKQLPSYLREHSAGAIKKIGLELDILPVNLYTRLQGLFPGVIFKDVSAAIHEIRMLKSPFEIALFRRAAERSAHVFSQIPALLQVGKPEIVLSSEIEGLLRREGHQGLLRMRSFNMEMYLGHVYSGESACFSTFLDSCSGGRGVTTACSQGAGWKPLAPHEPVTIDFSCVYEGYILDETRVFSIGELSPELQKAEAVAREIQAGIVAMAAPGVFCEDLYELACKLAARYNLADYFMGYADHQVKFVGHGLGLDLDELPVLSRGSRLALQPGMVFALEPKFVFPRQGLVGLENDWLVTETGLKKLTLIPDEMVVVPF